MLDRLLPRHPGEPYRGHVLALWLFGAFVLLKLAIGLISIFDGYAVASSADGIPLDAYAPAAARAVVTLIALVGVMHLALCLVSLLVLFRYRAMVPFMFALLLLEHLARRWVLHAMPIERTGAGHGATVNLILLALLVAGLLLSLWPPERREPPP